MGVRIIRTALAGMAGSLIVVGSAYAQADKIDPLQLPSDGIERTYACRSYLNAFSAMMKAHNLEKQSAVLFIFYLVLAKEAEKESAQAGISPTSANKREADWDAAVVVETLTRFNTEQAKLTENLKACTKMAANIVLAESKAPTDPAPK